jgi:hypothetical protein
MAQATPDSPDKSKSKKDGRNPPKSVRPEDNLNIPEGIRDLEECVSRANSIGFADVDACKHCDNDHLDHHNGNVDVGRSMDILDEIETIAYCSQWSEEFKKLPPDDPEVQELYSGSNNCVVAWQKYVLKGERNDMLLRLASVRLNMLHEPVEETVEELWEFNLRWFWPPLPRDEFDTTIRSVVDNKYTFSCEKLQEVSLFRRFCSPGDCSAHERERRAFLRKVDEL